MKPKAVSAHGTPDPLFDNAASTAAHLPAAKTTVPMLGVPVPSKYLKGMDSLLSIVQMPKGIPVAPFAIAKRVRPTPRCSLLRCWSAPNSPPACST